MKKLDKNANPCEICKRLNSGHPSALPYTEVNKCWSGPCCETTCLLKDRAIIKLLFLNLLGDKEFLEI